MKQARQCAIAAALVSVVAAHVGASFSWPVATPSRGGFTPPALARSATADSGGVNPPLPGPQRPAPAKRPAKAAPPLRLQVKPQLSPGLSLKYDLVLRLDKEVQRSGLIEDAQVPGKLQIETSVTMRLDVLAVEPKLSLRATCEKVTAESRGFLPGEHDDGAAEFRQLEGRVFDFIVETNGELAQPSPMRGDAALPLAALLAQLAHGVRAPRESVAPGQEWSSDTPQGRAQFQYLRNEACYEPAPAGAPPSSLPRAAESCALIRALAGQTRQQREGQETTVTSVTAGEALTWVSFTTGIPIRLEQTFDQAFETDYVRRADGAVLRIRIRANSTAHIALHKESLLVFP